MSHRLEDWGLEKGQRKTKLKQSKYIVGEAMYHYDAPGAKHKVEKVPLDKVHATQGYVYEGYGGASKVPALGVRTKNGDVHLVDGHHRAEKALARGQKSLKVDVVDHPTNSLKTPSEKELAFKRKTNADRYTQENYDLIAEDRGELLKRFPLPPREKPPTPEQQERWRNKEWKNKFD